MKRKQIRLGQLIAPFGPGSLYTDRYGVPHVIAGLDHWFVRWDQTLSRMVDCENPLEFESYEPRLSALLRVDRFRIPPDYRFVRYGESPPPNARLHIPCQRFPCWYRHTKTGALRRFNLHTVQIPKPTDGGRWQPVRFISVCAGGHLGEFPWKHWAGCNCADDSNLYLNDRGGTDLTSITIECRACGESQHLGLTTTRPDTDDGEQSAFQRHGITCHGDRTWLGQGANEFGCNEPLVAALINQINIYFSRTISAISLPNVEVQKSAVAELVLKIREDESALGTAKTFWRMGGSQRETAIDALKRSLEERRLGYTREEVAEAAPYVFEPKATIQDNAPKPCDPESELVSFRRAEFNTIRNQIDDPEHIPDLRVLATEVPDILKPWFNRVTLVERLRETRVFYGFDRLDQNPNPLQDMPQSAMMQLFRYPPQAAQDRWLPAVEVFGEGIYLELREEALTDWQRREDRWLSERIDASFVSRLEVLSQTLPPLNVNNRNWATRYLVVHTLAHVLLNQLVFECGYSTASLRERLYVSPDPDAPMAGLLVYTAAGDSEGTLGGLVKLGRPEYLADVIERALSRASWCSADPICSEHLGGSGSRLANLAACHACALLPETSCETINHGLDRGALLGTPAAPDKGFLSELISSGRLVTSEA
jgi:hypothetical protein